MMSQDRFALTAGYYNALEVARTDPYSFASIISATLTAHIAPADNIGFRYNQPYNFMFWIPPLQGIYKACTVHIDPDTFAAKVAAAIEASIYSIQTNYQVGLPIYYPGELTVKFAGAFKHFAINAQILAAELADITFQQFNKIQVDVLVGTNLTPPAPHIVRGLLK